MTREDQRRLADDGFVILPDFMDAPMLAALRRRVDSLFDEEGERAGSEFLPEPGCGRLANLVNKGEVFRQAVVLPRLLDYVRAVLGPKYKLSSLNARRVPDHTTRIQPLHADMAAIADARGYWVCNTVWMLDDFTPDNGALRVVPGSHRWGQLPEAVLDDPVAPHPRQTLVTGRAGSVVVLNAHTWHGGLANRTDAPRTALHAFFCRNDKPQQQFQKKLLDPDVQQRLTPLLRELLAIDDPDNDRLSEQVVTRSGLLK